MQMEAASQSEEKAESTDTYCRPCPWFYKAEVLSCCHSTYPIPSAVTQENFQEQNHMGDMALFSHHN